MTGSHQLIEQRLEQRIFGQILVIAHGRAKIDKPHAIFRDHHIVQAQIEVDHMRDVVHHPQQISALACKFHMRKRLAAVLEPAHIQLAHESALVLFDMNDLGHAAVVGRRQIALEDFQYRRLTRQECRENFLRKFSGPLFNHFVAHLRPSPLQAIHHRINLRHFLEHHQPVLRHRMPHQLDVIGESIGILAGPNQMNFTRDKIMQLAKQRQAEANKRRPLLHRKSVRRILICNIARFAAAMRYKNQQTTPAQLGEHPLRIVIGF